MKKVICDTNVWYDLHRNLLDLNALKNYSFVGTLVALKEIGTSENLLSNLELAKGAVKALLEHSTEVVSYDPWDFLILNNVDIDYIPEDNETFVNEMNDFKTFIYGLADDALNNEEQIIMLEEAIIEFNKPYQAYTDAIQNELEPTRIKGIENHGSRKNYI